MPEQVLIIRVRIKALEELQERLKKIAELIALDTQDDTQQAWSYKTSFGPSNIRLRQMNMVAELEIEGTFRVADDILKKLELDKEERSVQSFSTPSCEQIFYGNNDPFYR